MTLTRIFGVDFSGAANAGEHIWLTRATLVGSEIHVEDVFPAHTLSGSGRGREAAFKALRAFIAAQGDAWFGLDFPFGIHQDQMACASWLEFAAAFAHAYPAAEDLYRRHGGRGRELRRETDQLARPPFAPTNLRLFRQTYYGIRDLLAPLAAANAAVIYPMMARRPGVATLIEICPALTLRRCALRLAGYKGRGSEAHEKRRFLVSRLVETQRVRLAPEHTERMIADAGGDALDSMVGALGAAHTLLSGHLEGPFSSRARLEGVIFF